MPAHLFYGLFKLTNRFEYPLILAVIILLVITNILFFPGALSISVCNIVVIIFDVAVIFLLCYFLINRMKHKKKK